MDIKNVVKEICELNRVQRINYIIDFLKENQINYYIYNYKNGTNIEVVKKGKISNKEVVFLVHHDIMNYSYEGANDNTSSVAVMLHVARMLKTIELHCNVKIVFNDKEEYLGALISKNYSFEKINKIISSVGSYQYLKNNADIEKNLAIFIIELSGMGDSLYFASSSGNVVSDNKLNSFLISIAEKNKLNYIKIPISESDMISVNALKFRGTVLGAIPKIEGLNYLEEVKNNNKDKSVYPHVWKKNHTSMDKYFAIQEKALEMVYFFIIEILKNCQELEN